MDHGESKQAVAEKQQLSRQAHEHAQAQTQFVNAAHTLTQRATAHMHAQVSAPDLASLSCGRSWHVLETLEGTERCRCFL